MGGLMNIRASTMLTELIYPAKSKLVVPNKGGTLVNRERLNMIWGFQIASQMFDKRRCK
jgi:hypothetical protein